MIALLLAGALSAQPAPCIPDLLARPAAADQPGPCRPRPPVLMAVRDDAAPPPLERTPNLYRPKPGCDAISEAVARRVEVAQRGRPARNLHYAVLRELDGCGVPTPVGYHPDYLLPGAADPTVKPGDAPPRKR